MRRIILLTLVVALAFFGYTCVTEGIINDNFHIDIASFSKIEKESEKMTKELSDYDEKNEKQFEVAQNDLDSAIKEYENVKTEYNDLIETLGIEEDESEIVESTKTAYQIDFLWAIIGNYATKEGIKDLNLVFVESVGKAPVSSGYVLADLEFSVSGEYILIANFLYDLEDDDRLAFEINDFYMEKGKASFTVYNVPIESSTLTELSSSSTSTISPTTNSISNSQSSSISSSGNSTTSNAIKFQKGNSSN